MKLVIDIDDKVYGLLKYFEKGLGLDNKKDDDVKTALMRAVLNGIPLPKGHGRLIDADELKKHKYHDSNRYENAVAVAQIDWAETVIGADKGEQESEVQQ